MTIQFKHPSKFWAVFTWWGGTLRPDAYFGTRSKARRHMREMVKLDRKAEPFLIDLRENQWAHDDVRNSEAEVRAKEHVAAVAKEHPAHKEPKNGCYLCKVEAVRS